MRLKMIAEQCSDERRGDGGGAGEGSGLAHLLIMILLQYLLTTCWFVHEQRQRSLLFITVSGHTLA